MAILSSVCLPLAFGLEALLIFFVRLLVFCFSFFGGLFVCLSLDDVSGMGENVQAKEDDAKAARLSLPVQASTGTGKMEKSL